MVHIIVVLGLSRGIKNGKVVPNYYLEYRLQETLKVWNLLRSDDTIVICSGGCVNSEIPESQVMKEWLVENGLPEDRIYCEYQSRNTIENCVCTYSLITLFIKRGGYVKKTDEEMLNVDLELRQLGDDFYQVDTRNVYIHLITNQWHMPRSSSIFTFFMNRLQRDNYATLFYLSLHGSTNTNSDYNEIVAKENAIFQNFNPHLMKYEKWYPSTVCSE